MVGHERYILAMLEVEVTSDPRRFKSRIVYNWCAYYNTNNANTTLKIPYRLWTLILTNK